MARDTGTSLPEAADALLKSLHEDLSGLAASARLDAVLCLLEAARLTLAGDDPDQIRATMRAASLSVRGYLWANPCLSPDR
ncbi:hypothetical protein ABZX92_34580 [Lentzea sp. NPDC006480]|uniref:hypothetical protein n=1 Tax=Lentzea sp. NPDC006480 TaxID=3157176 RepID=UPI0033B9791E